MHLVRRDVIRVHVGFELQTSGEHASRSDSDGHGGIAGNNNNNSHRMMQRIIVQVLMIEIVIVIVIIVVVIVIIIIERTVVQSCAWLLSLDGAPS